MKTFKMRWDGTSTNMIKYACHLIKEPTEFVCNGRSYYDVTKLDMRLPFGITEIEYKGSTIKFEVIEFNDIKGLSSRTAKHEEVYISIDGKTDEEIQNLLVNFLDDADTFCSNKDNDSITIKMYSADSGGWHNLNNLKKRKIETIYLSQKKKKRIIEDINKFYEKADLYYDFGIPYKRIYLFSGPPGTGKTSFIFSLASMLNKNLSIINFDPKLNDSDFTKAIRYISDNSILLLEDIDSLFVNRENSQNNLSCITFSGILNVLDGIARKDNLLIFMTTNHIEKLDDALKRPGRVDYILSFTHLKKKQIKQMFNKFFPEQSSNFEKFYEEISDKEISPALLQKFLFDNIGSVDIIKKIPELLSLITSYEKLKHTTLYL